MTKYIFVTGGVVSSIGKGITNAGLLRSIGVKRSMQNLGNRLTNHESAAPDRAISAPACMTEYQNFSAS